MAHHESVVKSLKANSVTVDTHTQHSVLQIAQHVHSAPTNGLNVAPNNHAICAMNDDDHDDHWSRWGKIKLNSQFIARFFPCFQQHCNASFMNS